MCGCNGRFGVEGGRVGGIGSTCEGRLAVGKSGDFISFAGRGTRVGACFRG